MGYRVLKGAVPSRLGARDAALTPFRKLTQAGVHSYACFAADVRGRTRVQPSFCSLHSLSSSSGPEGAVEGAVLNGFGDVFGFNCGSALEVGDSPGDFQDAVMGAGGESLLSHGAFEQALAVGGQFTKISNMAR